MLTRRTLLATGTASLFAPSVARAAFALDPIYVPQTVGITKTYGAGQILVLPKAHFLYLITEPGRARRYGVGVGRAGLEFTGTAKVGAKRKWPDWRPTDEMIQREPKTYKRFVDNTYRQPGGRNNPLGARALYLYQNGRDTMFRIHGTTQPRSIGRSVSNGCIRMINAHVEDLYERVPIGTIVTVL
ncbi:MAG: L,D-transpeptidase [Rhodobacteraceae bacterium]|nr:L,D-transpeptidase [Paracoccaceae bacterium]